ncbi:MAG: hypothetical protein DRJ41_01300 [Thermoprotei archaeon]|mgnify:CR=1 FL=1|nr:MAG: hypothetical protein DRJ41_01300 [Thermoprotei archaeon]
MSLKLGLGSISEEIEDRYGVVIMGDGPAGEDVTTKGSKHRQTVAAAAQGAVAVTSCYDYLKKRGFL